MTVTDLTSIRRGRVGLHLDGAYHCALHPDAATGLVVGQELDDDTLAALEANSAYLSAKARALNMLSQRSYTAQGLYDKLARQDGEEAAAAAVERMLELNLLDDEDYARRMAGDLVNRKGFSASRAVRELMQKGIDRELAEEAVAGIETDPQLAIAEIVRKKYLQALEDEKGRRKTINALLRLGYRYGDIQAVLGNLGEDEHYYDD